jgi:hypothetical protein
MGSRAPSGGPARVGVDSADNGLPDVSGSTRPSTSSLRRFISSRPYVAIAELRRRFVLDDPDAVSRIERDGTVAWIGLPEREAAKLQDLWRRDEIGLEMSVEVRAPAVVGVYPMRIARYLVDVMPPSAVTGNGARPFAARPIPVQVSPAGSAE